MTRNELVEKMLDAYEGDPEWRTDPGLRVEFMGHALDVAVGELLRACDADEWAGNWHMTDKCRVHVMTQDQVNKLFVTRRAQLEKVKTPVIPESQREIINNWLKRHQPNGSRVSLVGDAMAEELLRELEAYRLIAKLKESK